MNKQVLVAVLLLLVFGSAVGYLTYKSVMRAIASVQLSYTELNNIN